MIPALRPNRRPSVRVTRELPLVLGVHATVILDRDTVTRVYEVEFGDEDTTRVEQVPRDLGFR